MELTHKADLARRHCHSLPHPASLPPMTLTQPALVTSAQTPPPLLFFGSSKYADCLPCSLKTNECVYVSYTIHAIHCLCHYMCHMFAYSMPYCVCYDVSCVCLPTTLCDHIQWYVWFPPKTKQTPFNPMCLLQPTFYPMCAPLTPFEPMCLQLDPMSAPTTLSSPMCLLHPALHQLSICALLCLDSSLFTCHHASGSSSSKAIQIAIVWYPA